MQLIIRLLLLSLFISNSHNGQEIWNYHPNLNTDLLIKDSRSDDLQSLRDIILNDSIGDSYFQYTVTVEYLYFNHLDSEAQFLINNLNTVIDTSLSSIQLEKQWLKFYTDKFFLGLLGDQNAIVGMDSVAKYSTNKLAKSKAIRNLGEIGRFDYYDYVKDSYLNNKNNISLNDLVLYAMNENHKIEVLNIINNELQNLNGTDYISVLRLIDYVFLIDEDQALNLLEGFFYNTEGKIRKYYFTELYLRDKDGQVKRAMDVIPLETDPYWQGEYIQNPRHIQIAKRSTHYLEPTFINFLLNVTLMNNDVNSRRLSYLRAYKPFKPDSTISEQEMIDSLKSFKDQSNDFGWIPDGETHNELTNRIDAIQSDIYSQSWSSALSEIESYLPFVENALQQNFITEDAYKFLFHYGDYIRERLVALAPQTFPYLVVKLTDSSGNFLTGGNLKYYEGGWKDAVDNGDGTFKVETDRSTVSLRMTYSYGSKDVSNVTAQNNTFTFQTVNTTAELRDSEGNLITDAATVKYYSGGWRDFGTTENGVATKELLPNNYSFRVTYAFASKDKKQDLNSNPTVIFNTVKAQVELRDSEGNLITDAATVKYYSGGWRDFGTTENGITTKELLPNNYSFRITHAFASKDKKQDLNTNQTVVFNTVKAQIELRDSESNLITDAATVKYYSGGWRDFGTTENGITTKELLPNNYSFRMTYEYISKDKKQDIATNNVVSYSTIDCVFRVINSESQPVDGAVISYYSGGWRTIGTTVSGEINKELFPANLSFRANYQGKNTDKKQDTSTNNVVEISVE